MTTPSHTDARHICCAGCFAADLIVGIVMGLTLIAMVTR